MARRFRFRLETVLRVRRIGEREAQRRVARKLREIARLDEQNRRTVDQIRQAWEELRGAQRGGRIDPLELARGRAWLAHLRRLVQQRTAHRARLSAELAGLQRELREARIRSRMLETLRERRWNEYRSAAQRREQAELDETARDLLAATGLATAETSRVLRPSDGSDAPC